MEDYPLEASIDVIQALKRALYLSRRSLAAEISLPPGVRSRLEKIEHKIENMEKGAEKLIGITAKSHDILFKTNTVFPFSLFPDTVVVDREKLTIANRAFFQTAKITSVPIRDILSIEADVGPFFGSVHLTSRYFFTNPHTVNYLRRKDTLKLQRLLQGYIIAHEQKLDCSPLETQKLVALLEDLGRGATD